MRLRFGDVTFDGEGRQLLRADAPVLLTPEAFRLLGLLLERSPAAVFRAESQDPLWPGVFITEGNTDSVVKEIRRALDGTSGESRLVRTVHGYRYAFDGTVHPERHLPDTARPLVVWGVQTFALGPGPSILGRAREADVWSGHESVSRAHARVTEEGDRAEIVDAGSRNGTFLHGARLTGTARIEDGDEIGLGALRVSCRLFGANPSAATKSVLRALTVRSDGRPLR